VATIRCSNCRQLTFTERVGYFWCDDNCKDAEHRRLLHTEERETRAAPPVRHGVSVTGAFQVLAAETEQTDWNQYGRYR
jgi:hypothetical protein